MFTAVLVTCSSPGPGTRIASPRAWSNYHHHIFGRLLQQPIQDGANPQEIYDRIATYLGDIGEIPGQSVPTAERASNRPVLATISQKWQRAIEGRLFRTLELRSTELDEFERILTGTRRRYLRVLRYYIVLPAYPASSR